MKEYDSEFLKRVTKVFHYKEGYHKYKVSSAAMREEGWPVFWEQTDEDALEMLQWLFEKLGFPLYLNKGYTGGGIIGTSRLSSEYYQIAIMDSIAIGSYNKYIA